VTLHNIGKVYSALGDNERALETFEQALAILREVGDRRGEAITLFNVAQIREARGEIPEAIALLERVVALDEAVQHPQLASDRAYLEHLRTSLQPPETMALLERVIALDEAVQPPPDDVPVVRREEARARPAHPVLPILFVLAVAAVAAVVL